MTRPTALTASLGAGGLVLMGAGLAGLDGAIVRAIGSSPPEPGWLDRFVAWLDLVSGMRASMFLLGLLILAAGLILRLARRRPLIADACIYVGLVQLAACSIVQLAKPQFTRLRPFQALHDGGWSDRWFMGPPFDSFPSGHVAFYFGLILPVVLLLPRWGLALLVVPLLVAVQRVTSLAHHPSDVAASVALVAFIAWLLRGLAPLRRAGL